MGDKYDGHRFVDDDDGACIFCDRPRSMHASPDLSNPETVRGTALGSAAETEGAVEARLVAQQNQGLIERAAFSSASKVKAKRQRNVIYAFGDGEFGKLGLGNTDNQKTPKLIAALQERDIIQLECGASHSMALAFDGVVYTWGHGGSGQLGHDSTDFQTLPKTVLALEGVYVVLVACGARFSAALDVEGKLYTWGENNKGQLGHSDTAMRKAPTEVMFLAGKHVIHMSAGVDHMACVTDEDEVFTWGCGLGGKLGHGDDRDCLAPKRTALDDKGIRQVRCLPNMTLAFTAPFVNVHFDVESGQAHAQHQDDGALQEKLKLMDDELAEARRIAEECQHDMDMVEAERKQAEDNSHNMESQQKSIVKDNSKLFFEAAHLKKQVLQAGKVKRELVIEVEGMVSSPEMLEELVPKRIKEIAIGRGHVLVLLVSRDVFAFGDNSHGQLGFGTREKKYPSPERVRSLANKNVKQIACGDYHSVALTYGGDVWTWGRGGKGQLGLGTKERKLLPCKVKGLLENLRVERIACGRTYTCTLGSNGKLYVFGAGEFAALAQTSGKGLSFIPVPVRFRLSSDHEREEEQKMSAAERNQKRQAEYERDARREEEGEEEEEGEVGSKHSRLTKADIKRLLDLGMDVEAIENMYPDVQSNPSAALFLTKEVNKQLQRQKRHLEERIEATHREAEQQQQQFVMNQEEAMVNAQEQAFASNKQHLAKLSRNLHERTSAHDQLKLEASNVEKQISELMNKRKENARALELVVSQSRSDVQGRLAKSRQDMQTQLDMAIKEKGDALNNMNARMDKIKKDVKDIRRSMRQGEVESKKLDRARKFDQFEAVKSVIVKGHALFKEVEQTSLKTLHLSYRPKGKLPSFDQLVAESQRRLEKCEKDLEEFDKDTNCDLVIVDKMYQILHRNIQLRKQSNEHALALLQRANAKIADDQRKRGQGTRLGLFS